VPVIHHTAICVRDVELRRIEASGVAMATLVDPDGVVVELIDTAAAPNLNRIVRTEEPA
jgi:hypothetical protein